MRSPTRTCNQAKALPLSLECLGDGAPTRLTYAWTARPPAASAAVARPASWPSTLVWWGGTPSSWAPASVYSIRHPTYSSFYLDFHLAFLSPVSCMHHCERRYARDTASRRHVASRTGSAPPSASLARCVRSSMRSSYTAKGATESRLRLVRNQIRFHFCM